MYKYLPPQPQYNQNAGFNYVDPTEYIRKIDGKRIMQKLNDKFEIEKLKEMAIDLREKQRKREQFEVIELWINKFN